MDSRVDVRDGGLIGYGQPGTEGGRDRLPSPPTQARGIEKRDRIYASAPAHYAADGASPTRVEDVTADAQVSWAPFSRYFPRKGAVLIELAARHFRDHVRAAAEAGMNDHRLSARTMIERTFAALLEPAET